MSKKLIFLMFTIFLIACSNKNVQNKFSEEQINSLYNFSIEIKENLSINNYEFLKENTDKSMKNERILTELEKIDFSNMNIFISKATFMEKNPISILGLNYGDDTYYFELLYNYDYHSKKWLIYKIKERR